MLSRIRLIFFLLQSAVFSNSGEKLFHWRDHSDVRRNTLPEQAEPVHDTHTAQHFLWKYGFIKQPDPSDPYLPSEEASEDLDLSFPQDVNESGSESRQRLNDESTFGSSSEHRLFLTYTSDKSDHNDIKSTPADHVHLESESYFSARSSAPDHLTSDSSIDQQFISALKEFQRLSGLAITGVFDMATRNAMNKPRCGVPDQNQKQEEDQNQHQENKMDAESASDASNFADNQLSSVIPTDAENTSDTFTITCNQTNAKKPSDASCVAYNSTKVKNNQTDAENSTDTSNLESNQTDVKNLTIALNLENKQPGVENTTDASNVENIQTDTEHTTSSVILNITDSFKVENNQKDTGTPNDVSRLENNQIDASNSSNAENTSNGCIVACNQTDAKNCDDASNMKNNQKVAVNSTDPSSVENIQKDANNPANASNVKNNQAYTESPADPSSVNNQRDAEDPTNASNVNNQTDAENLAGTSSLEKNQTDAENPAYASNVRINQTDTESPGGARSVESNQTDAENYAGAYNLETNQTDAENPADASKVKNNQTVAEKPADASKVKNNQTYSEISADSSSVENNQTDVARSIYVSNVENNQMDPVSITDAENTTYTHTALLNQMVDENHSDHRDTDPENTTDTSSALYNQTVVENITDVSRASHNQTVVENTTDASSAAHNRTNAEMTSVAFKAEGNTDTQAAKTSVPHRRRKRQLSPLVSKLGLSEMRNPSQLSRPSFSRRLLKWRVMDEGYSGRLSLEEQRYIFSLAFRMWSEVSPLQFEEDLHSPLEMVHVRLGFGTGRHLGCSQRFDGAGQEFAHAWFLGDIHFDDDEHFTIPSIGNGISLLKVAVHEIGHVLGLPHIFRHGSIMQPSYLPQDNGFEIDWLDRKAIQSLHGVCSGRFSVVFDWIRRERTAYGEISLRFNTYFMRGGRYWLYENRKNRTRYGDPLALVRGWHGLPGGGVDAHVHVWNRRSDSVYFFKGLQFWQYDRENDQVFSTDSSGHSFPRLISDGFPGVSGPLDTAFYNRRDAHIYFFKGRQVLKFDVRSHRVSSTSPQLMTDVFPALVPGDHPVRNLDAAYFSYTHGAVFLLKGARFWRVASAGDQRVNNSIPLNGVAGNRKVQEQWFDICDVHSSLLRTARR